MSSSASAAVSGDGWPVATAPSQAWTGGVQGARGGRERRRHRRRGWQRRRHRPGGLIDARPSGGGRLDRLRHRLLDAAVEVARRVERVVRRQRAGPDQRRPRVLVTGGVEQHLRHGPVRARRRVVEPPGPGGPGGDLAQGVESGVENGEGHNHFLFRRWRRRTGGCLLRAGRQATACGTPCSVLWELMKAATATSSPP